jgi:hypothetical protein
MKNTYAAPTLTTSGDVVRETRNGQQKSTFESIPLNKRVAAGSVGFDL